VKGFEPNSLVTQYEDLSISQDASQKLPGPRRRERGGGGGGAQRQVPDIASKVRSGDDDLEDSKEDPIFDSQGRTNQASCSKQPSDEAAIFQLSK